MSPRPVRHLCGCAVLALGAVFAGATADGRQGPQDADKGNVKVSVIAIVASERDHTIDPRLQCIAREVQKTHKNLKGFQVSRMTCRSLAVGARETFDLAAGQTATVTVHHGADKHNRVELKVAPPEMGEITYDTCCGKFLPIVTPIHTANNELLIIAVRVQPCHGR
jgi:hypothetical protein